MYRDVFVLSIYILYIYLYNKGTFIIYQMVVVFSSKNMSHPVRG